MRLVLPYPPSANTYWRHNRGRTHVSNEARAYRTRVLLQVLTARDGRPPHVGPVVVTVTAYRPARRGDLDNTLKVLLDALRGAAYQDDSQVVELHAMRFDDKANPRVVVSVEAA
jgi:crossover junction endodeoxyribonuclease RusA